MIEPSEIPAPSTALWTETLGRQLENLRPGAHVFQIYTNRSEQLRVLVSFFRGALIHGGRCLYIADPERADEVSRALRALGQYAADALDRGALILVTTRQPYVNRWDGRFEPQGMLALLAASIDRARLSGFSELRIAGEMAWVLGEDTGSERFPEFEALLNETLPATGSSGLCQLDRRRTQPHVIRDALRTHPVAIIDLRLHTNVYYEPIDLVLGKGDADRARVDWMITQLQSVTRRETALADLGRLALEGASADLMGAAETLVASELGLDYVQIFELVHAGGAAHLTSAMGADLAAPGAIQQLDGHNLLASTSLRAGLPLIVSDWPYETRFKPPTGLAEAGVTSSAAVVISTGPSEPVYGMLVAHSRAARVFSDDDVLFLETVGTFLAHAIAAARSTSSFRALVENAPEVIVRFDNDLRVAYVNPAIERVTGTAAESLVGKPCRDLGILEALLPAWELVLRQVWRTGREQSFEFTARTPLGERVFDSRIVPELGGKGEVQSVFSISRDITEQRWAEAERSELYRDLVAQQNRVQELMERLAQNRGRSVERIGAAQLKSLSDRDRHLLRLLAAGRTNREIGAEIGLTTGTVKNLVAQMLAKLNVTDRTQAAVRAVEFGVLETAEG
jgi:PAS domain S-box-containing protein